MNLETKYRLNNISLAILLVCKLLRGSVFDRIYLQRINYVKISLLQNILVLLIELIIIYYMKTQKNY